MAIHFHLPKILLNNDSSHLQMVENVALHLSYLKKQQVGLVIEQYLHTHPEIDYLMIYTNSIGRKEEGLLELDVQLQINDEMFHYNDTHLEKFRASKEEKNIFYQLLQLWEDYPQNNFENIIQKQINLSNIDEIKKELNKNTVPSFDNKLALENNHFYNMIALPQQINNIQEYQNIDTTEIKEHITFLKKQEFILTLEQFFKDNQKYDIPDLVFKIPSHSYRKFEIHFPEEIPFARTLDGIELNKKLQHILRQEEAIYSMILPLHNRKLNCHNFYDIKSSMLSEKENLTFEKLYLECFFEKNNEQHYEKTKKIKI
jgi:hypothetical protein